MTVNCLKGFAKHGFSSHSLYLCETPVKGALRHIQSIPDYSLTPHD